MKDKHVMMINKVEVCRYLTKSPSRILLQRMTILFTPRRRTGQKSNLNHGIKLKRVVSFTLWPIYQESVAGSRLACLLVSIVTEFNSLPFKIQSQDM
jgi:hypothetical protein